MNKTKGFTLAEVLITLGIVGVVAAMSAPSLVQNAAAAKTGPAMSRAISSLANGMQAFLAAKDSTKLDTAGGAGTSTELFNELDAKYVKMNVSSMAAKPILDNDSDIGGTYQVYQFGDRSAVFVPNSEDCDPNTKVIDSTKTPNITGCVFYFAPIGWASKNSLILGDDVFELAYDNEGDILIYGLEYGEKWDEKCSDPANMESGASKRSCGGRIAAHNYKKDY